MISIAPMTDTPAVQHSKAPSTRMRMATPAAIEAAIRLLEDGGVVGFPTETVYGLGADARNPTAVTTVFALKGRPADNPLIAHVSGIAMAETLVRVEDQAQLLMEAFWPGPLTLVLPYTGGERICTAARAGLQTIALRQPAHRVASALIGGLGRAIVAPSANRSGRLSPTTPQRVAGEFSDALPLILSDGACAVGLESTVLGVSDNGLTLLRPGGLALDVIEAVAGPVQRSPASTSAKRPAAPGMRHRHYAPGIPLRMDARDLREAEAYLGFGPNPFAPKGGMARLNLSPQGDLEEAARNLFAMLARLEASGAAGIAVAPVPTDGLGAAINDRLRRASEGSTQ